MHAGLEFLDFAPNSRHRLHSFVLDEFSKVLTRSNEADPPPRLHRLMDQELEEKRQAGQDRIDPILGTFLMESGAGRGRPSLA